MATLLFIFQISICFIYLFLFSMCCSDLFAGISLLSFGFPLCLLSGISLSICFLPRGFDLICSALLGKERRCYVYRQEGL